MKETNTAEPVNAAGTAAMEDAMDALERSLTEQERTQVEEYISQIDLSDAGAVLRYGAATQKKIADFSQTALNNVRTKDLGEVGEQLSRVVNELKGIDEEEPEKGFLGIFRKKERQADALRTKYAKAEDNVDAICQTLEEHQRQLLKDAALLDQMYELNLEYYRELSMYVLAGYKRLNQIRSQELPALVEKAKQSGLQEDARKAQDMAQLCERFEKKIHDLDLTRTVAMQMAPQIRLIQNNDTVMSEKIQSTLVNTIPLWKSQITLSIGIAHSTQAAKAQRDVTDMTNELLRKNAEPLKPATQDPATESERGIVDKEPLTATNQSLIETLDEVMRIQQEGREKRRDAETELRRIEDEMKEKLLEIGARG